MGIIDFHVHLGRREHLTPHMIQYLEDTLGPHGLDFMDILSPRAFGDFLKNQGIDHAVILSEYSPRVTGTIPSEFTGDFCRDVPELIAFGSIDLESSVSAGEQVEHCVRDLGCKGLKLLPSYGHYYPNDERLLSGYEAAQDLGIPIMFHTGTSLFPKTRIRYANPLLLDDIADDFPNLSIVMCHGGRPFWYREAAWLLSRHKNLHIDISGIPPKQLPSVFPKIDNFFERFVFGSDWPTEVASISDQADKIRALPMKPRTISALLRDNAARLLGLS
ncbi:MAG: uncharacterized protein QG577_2304 [Thermodesulfobacteriota bacterium]|nr:uncharacterized protein [Thermodesulfobacteriota bacterium]